jgi:quinolinate synthase
MEIAGEVVQKNQLLIEIDKLKKERNAVILVHNYQLGEVQEAADILGDSLGLSIEASRTEKDVIVFCGVHFMAETAKILSPEKTVLLPFKSAGCPMADMVTPEGLINLKKKHPDAVVITYVNSTATTKAEADYCCTSSNAEKIVNSLPVNQKIIFAPDMNLGAWVTRKRPDNVILWPGFCPVHQRMTLDEINIRRAQYPKAKFIVHPEARMEILKVADAVESTGGMVEYVKSMEKGAQLIVGTEGGMITRLKKERPDIQYIVASVDAVCANMKLTRLVHVRDALVNMTHKIEVPDQIAKRARISIKRMIEIV